MCPNASKYPTKGSPFPALPFSLHHSRFSFIICGCEREELSSGSNVCFWIYSCLFFFLTGLHFFHLLVGLLLLSLLFWSCSFYNPNVGSKEKEEENCTLLTPGNAIDMEETFPGAILLFIFVLFIRDSLFGILFIRKLHQIHFVFLFPLLGY